MRTTKMKSIVYVCIAIIGTGVIVLTVNTINANQDPITEKNVRSQLEELYDAEVAEVKKNEDVFEAIIAKSGEVYLVEMNANTGDVNSLEHTDEFIIEEVPIEVTNEKEDRDSEVSQKITTTQSTENIGINQKNLNKTSKVVVTEKAKKSSTNVKVVENSKGAANNTKKQSTSKNEKAVEEKPMKETIKDVLKKEENKTEASSKEKKKVEEVKKEPTTKADISKTASVSGTIKVDTEKEATLTAEPIIVEAIEGIKSDEPQSIKETTSLQTEEKSGAIEKNTTVLITAEEALKLTLAHQKGVVESNTFIRTDEGGYYLIVMEATPKESAKEKKSKATVQVHAISGKILSVTWE